MARKVIVATISSIAVTALLAVFKEPLHTYACIKHTSVYHFYPKLTQVTVPTAAAMPLVLGSWQ